MQAISSALSLLGNGNESATSQTKAAIGQNIQIETDTPENLQGLSREIVNANQQVQKQSLEKMQERQEMAKVIGELADSGLRRVTETPLKEADAKRQQAEAIAKENPAQAEALKAEAKAIEAEYGLGSDLQMGVRAATAALQGLATNDINQAIVGAASPYLNQEIKKGTTNADGTVNTQANLIAHALLGAAEAKVTGNNALAGATAAVTAEAAAPHIMQILYQTDNPAELNEAQKRNVANLSQSAAGLSGGLVGDSTQSAVSGAEIGKRAVENNVLKVLSQNPEYAGSLLLKTKGDEIKGKVEEKATEEAVDVIDEYAPHYINIGGELYIVGVKGTINLRNGDTFVSGSFSPLVLPSRGVGASANLGWVTNLEKSDMKDDNNNRITGGTLSDRVISGTGVGISGCYYACVGYGQTVSSNSNSKTYRTFELGVGKGVNGKLQKNSLGITEEKTMKIGD